MDNRDRRATTPMLTSGSAAARHRVCGGMTDRQRRALLRRRPDVRSWAQLFEGVSQHHVSHG